MFRTLLVALLAIRVGNVSFAQDSTSTEEAKIKKLKIAELHIQTGNSMERYGLSNMSDFVALGKGSQLLLSDLSKFTSNQYNGYNFNTGAFPFVYGSGDRNVVNVSSIMLGFKFYDKDNAKYKTNPLLRIGLSYYLGSVLTNSFSKTTVQPIDTLTSSQTGQVIYLDSVNQQNYFMNYSTEQIRIDASLLYRTNYRSRWMLYSGIGFNTGISFNAFTTIYYNNYNYTNVYSGTQPTNKYIDYSTNSKTETIKNRSVFFASAYIPLGVDFKLGTKKSFWKQLHLYYEMKPAFNLTAIPELNTRFNFSFVSTMGLKVVFNSYTKKGQ